ncbi:hypothetical protein GCG54_00015310, partial [Colletotrichum gloeosporioides]
RARCASPATFLFSGVLVACLTVVRDKFLRGSAVVDPDLSNNAYAVAVAHQVLIPGVPIPDLTPHFIALNFPSVVSTKMDDKAPPTVGKGAIIMINSPKSFGGMDVEDITMKENTSDFTRRQSATTRYWKAPLKFKKNGKVVDSLHISNIRIPYFKDKAGKYGRETDGDFYACFDPYVREGIARMSSREQDMKIPLEERAP